MGTLTILLTSGPYSSRHPEFACRIADEALKKGHKVNMFLYMDGVLNAKKGQITKDSPNIGEALAELLKWEKFKVIACIRSAQSRGIARGEADSSGSYPTDEYVAGAVIKSLHELGNLLKASDKVIALTGGR
mgnify:CR=1 FL=1